MEPNLRNSTWPAWTEHNLEAVQFASGTLVNLSGGNVRSGCAETDSVGGDCLSRLSLPGSYARDGPGRKNIRWRRRIARPDIASRSPRKRASKQPWLERIYSYRKGNAGAFSSSNNHRLRTMPAPSGTNPST